jgi:hypothetical protein
VRQLEEIDMETQKNNPILRAIVFLGIAGAVAYYCNRPPTPEEAAATAAQHVAAMAQKLDAEKTGAAKMGVSLAAFQWGEAAVGMPSTLCQNMVVNSARYGAKAYWAPAYSWAVAQYPDRPSLTIRGHDVEMNNGFGAKMEVTYTCRADYLTIVTLDDKLLSDQNNWRVTMTDVAPTH